MKLLVAALEIELEAFPDSIPGYDRLITRIGKLNAALELTRALERGTYDEVLVLGTAGLIDEHLPAGVYEIAGAVQHDVEDLAGAVGHHMAMPHKVETGRDGVIIATGDLFVQDTARVDAIRGLGASLVDMETYVYIWVCQQYGVPIRVVKAVSDSAQDGAVLTWREQVVRCSHDLLDWFHNDTKQQP
ncbi:nucleoside phosphorylase [Timonella sp. A28]|uniref:phosphorylase family protein n=1 Tax=Timonella sp. A28 TaxID=3442640 RepID=UPI003EBA7D17